MELGQVQTSLGLVSQETQVTHMQGLTVGWGLTLVWELGERGHHWAPHFTHVRELKESALLHISTGKTTMLPIPPAT